MTRTIRSRTCCAAAISAALLAPPALTQESDEVRRYDLRLVCAAPTTNADDERLDPSALPLAELPAGTGEPAVIREWSIEPSWVLDMAQRILRQHGQSETAQLDGAVLVVAASAAAQAEIHDFLAEVESVLRPGCEVLVASLPARPTAMGMNPVLTRDAAEALLTRTGGASVSRVEAGGGRVARITAVRRVPVVWDWDVEVAQASSIPDPRVAFLYPGLVADVWAMPLANGRIEVRVEGRLSDIEEPVASVKLTAKDHGRMHVPAVHSVVRRVSGCVADGGALLVGEAGSDGGLWLIRVNAMPPVPRAQPAVGWRAVAHAAMFEKNRYRAPATASRVRDSLAHVWLTPARAELAPLVPAMRVIESIRAAAFPNREDVLMDMDSEWLLVRGSDADRDAAEGAVLEMRAADLATAGFEFRVGVVGADVAAGLVTGRISAAEVAGTLSFQGLLTGMVGRQMQLTAGWERSTLSDYDVEIAQEKALPNPMPMVTFDGVSIDAKWLASPSGHVRLLARLIWTRAGGQSEPFATELDTFGMLDLPQTDMITDDIDTVVDSNRGWHLLTVQALPNRAQALVAMVKMGR